MSLTDTVIRTAKPGNKPIRKFDGGGLYIEITPRGGELRRTLGRAEAEADGWFNGPPYAVAESVFDEDYMMGCSTEPEAEEAS